MFNKSSIDVLISSLSKPHRKMALELTESCLKNKFQVIQEDCRLLTSTKSFHLKLSCNMLDVIRNHIHYLTYYIFRGNLISVLSYSIYLILKSNNFNIRYIEYNIDNEIIESIQTTKSKIIILDTYSKIYELKEALKLWKIPFYDISYGWDKIIQSCKKSICERLDDTTLKKIPFIHYIRPLTEAQKLKILTSKILKANDLYALNNIIKFYGLPMYDIKIVGEMKKIINIQADVILISENYQRDFTVNNFFNYQDFPYQYYFFNCSQRTKKDFYENLSFYIKSRIDITDDTREHYNIIKGFFTLILVGSFGLIVLVGLSSGLSRLSP